MSCSLLKDNQLLLTGTIPHEMELVGCCSLLSVAESGAHNRFCKKIILILSRAAWTMPCLRYRSLKNNLIGEGGRKFFYAENTRIGKIFLSRKFMSTRPNSPSDESGHEHLLTKTYFAMGDQESDII